MDNTNYTTNEEKCKKNSHLSSYERGRIQQLYKEGVSLRGISRELGRAPNTIKNELKRGTGERKGSRGRVPSYSPKRAEKVYADNRKSSKKPYKKVAKFVNWVIKQKQDNHWSFDAAVGHAKARNLFDESEMVCSKTLYNWLYKGLLPITIFDMPEVLKRKKQKKRTRKNVRILGRSIEERRLPEGERGHWEGDTVVGQKTGKDEVILTLAEIKMGLYIAIKIPDKSADSVLLGMLALKEEYGEKFPEIFKTITFDNGTEFSSCSEMEAWGTTIYFAHPYSSWERPVNERTNRMLRAFIKKGEPISNYSQEDIDYFVDLINALPRKSKDYCTAEELFNQFLDDIFAA